MIKSVYKLLKGVGNVKYKVMGNKLSVTFVICIMTILLVTIFCGYIVSANTEDIMVDRFGQLRNADFPTKVTSEQELVEDLARDREYYESLTPPERDKYGASPGSREKYGLRPTGFFHVETLDNGKMALVAPNGNLYFNLGTTGVGYHGDTFTIVKGREHIYEWLPEYREDGKFESAFRTPEKGADFSFYVANRIRKTGKPFIRDEFYDETVYRMKKWGFTGAGGWSGSISESGGKTGFPIVLHADLSPADDGENGMGGINCFDIFAPGAEEHIDSVFQQLVTYKDNPYIIGYFFANEASYNNLKTELPKKKASEVAAKKVMVDMFKERYKTINLFNALWETDYESFDELYEAPIPINTEAASEDLGRFIAYYLDTYYGTAAEVFRKYDKNHLLLGDRWLASIPKDNQLRKLLSEAAGKYMDVISYNYYSYDLDMDLLESIFEYSGIPIMLTEFMFTSPEQGLTGGIRVVDSEGERGLAYRDYVEQSASTGFIVGTHMFQYLDQATTGRWFQGYDGENFACGLINVTDRPYKKMLESVMETNYRIYEIITGEKEPFDYDYGPGRSERKNDKVLNIPETTSLIIIDGIRDSNYGESPAAVLDSKDLVLGRGGEDLKAEIYFAWDSNYLYVYAKITDPTPMMNPKTGVDIWNGDAVELFIGPEKVDEKGALLAADTQIILSGGGIVEGKFQSHYYNNLQESNIDLYVEPGKDGNSYSLEAAIPMASINIEDASVGRKLRFDVGFDDGDMQSRKRQWLWNGMDGNHMSRDKWGKAVFVEEGEK